MEKQHYYACIDLKSFYASVECVERDLDPMKTDLVVADIKRTKGTICLAVSPSLKEKGVKNRCRLFQIPNKLLENTIIAPPRMQKYIDYSARIYGVYLGYISKEDIYPYSVDEAFIDLTPYLKLYHKTPREMAKFLMDEVYEKVGVRATAGVGTNMYLAKVALDILAKHADDFIGELTEENFAKKMWDHQPITDFWRIGPGIAKRLAEHRMFSMRDIANADPQVLYRVFGIDAELMIDHAWGREPVTIADVKKYKPKDSSISLGQVLPRDYKAEETGLVVREMMREVMLRCAREGKVATSVTLVVVPSYKDKIATMNEHDLRKAENYLSGSAPLLGDAIKVISDLFDKIVDSSKMYRRIYINLNKLTDKNAKAAGQKDMFKELFPEEKEAQEKEDENERIEKAILKIRDKHGKSAIMTAEDLEEAGTTRARNNMIGGHQANVE